MLNHNHDHNDELTSDARLKMKNVFVTALLTSVEEAPCSHFYLIIL